LTHIATCDWLYFFFQAEDGIRDDLVTGVQTCALPISPRKACIPVRSIKHEEAWISTRALHESIDCAPVAVGTGGVLPAISVVHRSEERRVGKEGRCRV